MASKKKTVEVETKDVIETEVNEDTECTCECGEDCTCDEIPEGYEAMSLEELQSMMGGGCSSGMQHSCSYSFTDLLAIDDLDERRLYLNCAIDKDYDEPDMFWNKVEEIVYHIMGYNREDKLNEVPIEERKPIMLYISSPGGSVVLGNQLIDVIRLSKTPVYTINMGMCYSMGLLIYLAGHKRYCLPSGSFLLHNGSTCAYGDTGKVFDRIMFDKEQTEKRIKRYVLDRTNLSEEMYDSKYRNDWYTYPEEAKLLGICDIIVGKDCDLDDIL